MNVGFLYFEGASQSFVDDIGKKLKEVLPKDTKLILLTHPIGTIPKEELLRLLK